MVSIDTVASCEGPHGGTYQTPFLGPGRWGKDQEHSARSREKMGVLCRISININISSSSSSMGTGIGNGIAVAMAMAIALASALLSASASQHQPALV